MTTFESKFNIRDKVNIDDDPEITAFVKAVSFRTNIASYEIEWADGGAMQSAWVPDWRIEKGAGK